MADSYASEILSSNFHYFSIRPLMLQNVQIKDCPIEKNFILLKLGSVVFTENDL